jgi:hypothetical protein
MKISETICEVFGRTGFRACRGGGQAVHEWGTNKRMWMADRRRRTAGWAAGKTVDGGRWTMDGWTAEDGLLRLRGGGQTVHEWGTNKRMWTADRRPRTAGWTAEQNVDDGWTADDGRWRTGFRGFGEGGRPSTNGERINECGRRIADRGRRDGRRGRAWTMDGRRTGGRRGQ